MDVITPSVVEQRRSGTTAATASVSILMCTNALFLQHTAVCLASLLANNPDSFFDIVIVRRATEELNEEKLRRSLAGFSNHRLTFQKFTPPAGLLLPLLAHTHYTIDTYTRLWLGEFFPEQIDRVLYLDADIVVVGSIAQLWNTDLGGALMGAVDIPGSDQGVRRLGMRLEDGYFNAGVLLIDLPQWRATRGEITVLDYIRANPERVSYDQDALNACFRSRTKQLDYKWNVIRRDARIIHFNGGTKPWSYFCDHPRRAEYERYLRMTEWRNYVPPDRTPMNMVRKGISAMTPAPVKRLLKTMIARVVPHHRSADAV
jgi:lipopolysaccharide biosynthesis glycosyltransferase